MPRLTPDERRQKSIERLQARRIILLSKIGILNTAVEETDRKLAEVRAG